MSTAAGELEREVEASRSRLDGALSKLQRRLNVPGIVEDMLGAARRSEVGADLYDGAVQAVRRNPLPVLLVCAGALMLLRGKPLGRSSRSNREPENLAPRLPTTKGTRT